MREAFSRCLVQAAKANPRLVLLTGDHGYALFDEFRKECGSQYLNAGVAEQNMVGVAAGLAKVGFFPVVYGLSSFVPIRVLEQIKMDLCYEGLPALLIGDGAGVVYSYLGASHQSTEDIGALRAVANVSIYSPADAAEMEWCFSAAIASGRSCYLRMGKADLGRVHESGVSNPLANPVRVLGSIDDDIAFVATGSMVRTAIRLAEQWRGVSVWSVPRLKPLHDMVMDVCIANARKIVTFEEHSVHGGLGSIVAELSARRGSSMRATLLSLGIDNQFSDLCGSYEYLMDWHGLSEDKLHIRLRRFLEGDDRTPPQVDR
ncbi:transketolase family protein [Steroidobacter cummioxidans]|uniref:transketolase family protein n=1 Tax=Steroidobacter cummioxidans TaxID=1803913 RepID=UPI000E31A36D|nr:transketolase C-terminal domain-containing protein [Steroidobacter cummioxidans]